MSSIPEKGKTAPRIGLSNPTSPKRTRRPEQRPKPSKKQEKAQEYPKGTDLEVGTTARKPEGERAKGGGPAYTTTYCNPPIN